jgi:hypothetical protein
MLLAGTACGAIQAQPTVGPADRSAAHQPQDAPHDSKVDEPERPLDVEAQLKEAFDPGPPQDDSADNQYDAPASASEGIVVTKSRPRGSVESNIPPERTFSPIDIRAFGASTVSEVLQAIASQAGEDGSGQRAPVTLLNGRRVSDFSEIARIPSEAIERMEVFPAEVALRYGYAADQKVVNIVTFETFASKIGQAGLQTTTEVPRDGQNLSASLFSINGDTRYGIGASFDTSGSILESDRNLLQPFGGQREGQFRTLVPQSTTIAFDGTISSPIGSNTSATADARFQHADFDSLIGTSDGSVLAREFDTKSYHAGTTIAGSVGRWRWTFTGNADQVDTTITTHLGDNTVGEGRSRDFLLGGLLLLNGSVADLPAGPIGASLSAGISTRDFESASILGAQSAANDLSRTSGIVSAAVSVPLLANRKGANSPIGSLTANANLSLEPVSDFGTLRTFGYGLNWAPMEGVNAIVSFTKAEAAPSLEQLGAPIITTPNARVLDFTRLDTVETTRLFGGTPDLQAQDTSSFRIGIDAKPFAATDLFISVDYFATDVDRPIAPFPILTQAVEGAFGDRVIRDAAGALALLDARPVNFSKSRQKQLRWGVSYSRRLGPIPPGFEAAGARVFNNQSSAQQAFPGSRVVVAEAGSPLARGMENLSSRLYFSIYHTWFLEDELQLRAGLPSLDLLDGGAVDFRGGRRRHGVELQVGAFKGGLGGRVSANWQSGTRIGKPEETGNVLDFNPNFNVNLALFANLTEAFPGLNTSKILAGTRLSFTVSNLFNFRPAVDREFGAAPLIYQSGYLDPIGRTISLTIRKVF